MISKQAPVTTPQEETADFRKPEQITDIDYLPSRKDFQAAAAKEKPQTFLSSCFAVINQKNAGTLSIRESAFAISSGIDSNGLNASTNAVIEEATSLRRHPANYKADHQIGWSRLVKKISDLRKRI